MQQIKFAQLTFRHTIIQLNLLTSLLTLIKILAASSPVTENEICAQKDRDSCKLLFKSSIVCHYNSLCQFAVSLLSAFASAYFYCMFYIYQLHQRMSCDIGCLHLCKQNTFETLGGFFRKLHAVAEEEPFNVPSTTVFVKV